MDQVVLRPRNTVSKCGQAPTHFEKFWPRQWLVAPWMPLPVSGMKAYTGSRGSSSHTLALTDGFGRGALYMCR
jgi:hypothetical protein